MILAKLSTALTVSFGPVLASDGTEYTGAAVGDVKICKQNGTPAALNGSATLTHKEVGMYELALTTSDISAVGQMTVQLSKTTYIAPPLHLNVLPAAIYDSLVAGTATASGLVLASAAYALGIDSAGKVAVPDTQKVDVNTIKTQAVTCAAGVTVLASVGTAATSTAQTGDSYARLGSPAGASIAADLVVIDNFVDDLESRLTATRAGYLDVLQYLPSVVAGGSGGLFIAGTNAATSITTALTANITGNLSGSVGSVTGAVGSVTGAVGSVTAAVTLPSIPAGWITAAGIATDAIDADALADNAVDAIWDEAIIGHLGAGTVGNALNAAGSAGDPWSTPLPGAYGAGTAGKIIGDNINAPIGTVDTVVGAIKAKTDNLPSDPADQSAVEAAITAATSPLATAAALATVDGIVDSILADTGTDGVVVAAASKTGYALSAAGLDAVVIETGLNARQAMSVIASAVAGILSGAATATVVIKAAQEGTTTRVTATCDADGNRSAVTLNLPT